MTPEIQAGTLCADFAGALLGPWPEREGKGERGAMGLIFATASLFCGNKPDLAFEDVLLVATAHMFGLQAQPAQDLTSRFGGVIWNGLAMDQKNALVEAIDAWIKVRTDANQATVHRLLSNLVEAMERV